MRKIQYILYVAFVALFFTACQEDDFGGAEQGGIRIALADGTTGVDVTTRSTPSELFDGFKKKFKFQIKGGDNYDQTHEWTEDVIPLAAGVYEIIATCGTEQAAGVVEFDKPCYTGKAEGIKVEVGKEAKAEVKCKVTNALVSIKFAEGYETYAENAYAMIAVGSGIETNWAELSESAYFKAGSSLTKLVLYKNGSESLPADILTEAKKVSGFPETFKAGDHLILTLSVAKKNGNVSFKVSKVELKEVTIEETIPMEWLPKPSVSATGFDSNNSLTFAETETKEAKLDLKLASALQDIKFKFNFKDEQFSSLTKEEYLWSNEEDKKVISEQLSINVSDKSVDLNGLLAKLQTNAGATTTNTIEVDVKANNRWSSEDKEANRTYTITCNKPVFHVDAYPGNIWTKEFTMNALREEQVESGDFAKITRNIKYQYSTDGENNWMDLSDDLRKDQLEPGTTYYIRGLYRDAVPSEVVEVKTYPETLLTNGGLENYNITIGADGKVAQDRGARYAWNSWATTNPLTTPNCHAAAYAHNSRSGVRPTSDKPSTSEGTTAVRVITTGYGYGSTYNNVNNFIHSELFLGTEPEEDNDNRSYGISFDSRPTALGFYYKCISNVGNDKSEARIELYHDDTLLGSGVFQTEAKGSYEYKEVSVNYSEDINILKLEPNKLVVIFKSGTKDNLSQSDLKKMFGSSGLIGGNTNTTADCMWRGNELFIDDIQLIYDK